MIIFYHHLITLLLSDIVIGMRRFLKYVFYFGVTYWVLSLLLGWYFAWGDNHYFLDKLYLELPEFIQPTAMVMYKISFFAWFISNFFIIICIIMIPFFDWRAAGGYRGKDDYH